MKLYYTGASKFNAIQLDPVKSLGGYISSSEVQDSLLNNIWGDVSKFGIWNSKKSECRAIALKNDAAVAATNLKAIFQYPDGTDESDSMDDNSSYICTFQIGWEPASVDDCGDLLGSKITSPYASPLGVTFYSADGLENALNMPNLASGQYLIIWLKRTISDLAKQPLTDDQYADLMNKVTTLPTLEDVNVRIIWDGV